MSQNNSLEVLLKSGFAYRGSYADQSAFFADVSQRLVERGCVTSDFNQAIVSRELKYPTGLELPSGGVCLPHADPQYVIEDGLVIVLFERPIEFRAMDDPTHFVHARAAFVLHMTDAHHHLSFLKQVVQAIQEPDLFDRLEQLPGMSA